MKRIIYADNAATTKLDPEALQAMLPFLNEEYANPSQPYSFSKNSRSALSQARDTIAKGINSEPEEIFFTSGGTESDNWAIKGAAMYNGRNKPIIVSSFEHHAVLNACKHLEEIGFPVAYLQPTEKGLIETYSLSKMIHTPSLVSIMLVNNELGSIQPIKELAEVAHKHGAVFHTDAVQALGHIPVDVKMLGVDMLSASAHKFNGPKGIGFLYIKKGTELYPYMDGGSQEKGQRAGTENVAAIVGMAAALKNNCISLTQNRDHIENLSKVFLSNLNGGFVLNGTNRYEGIINISFRDISGESLFHMLDLKGICISTGAACNSIKTQISHVLDAIRLPEEYAKGTIRVSFGRDNTEEDAIFVAEAINIAVAKLRDRS